jgi:aspartate carbamoyltransferase catalytic subunit
MLVKKGASDFQGVERSGWLTAFEGQDEGHGLLENFEHGRHVIDARQFTRDWMEASLFPLALSYQSTPANELQQVLSGKRLFYLFHQESTRTRISFESAVTLLGGTVAGLDSQEIRLEPERLEDRIRIINGYGYDFIVIRYHEQGGALRAAAVSETPVINAGDGDGQHPTQALLDLYTLWREFGRLDGLRLALVGDLRYERTTNSLAYALARFKGIKLYLVSPQTLRISETVREYLHLNRVDVVETTDLREIASDVDVIYMTRAQGSRMDYALRLENGEGCYRLTPEVMASVSPDALILHPLPRGPELPAHFDADPRVACFRQAQNGLYVRMALLSLLAQQDTQN